MVGTASTKAHLAFLSLAASTSASSRGNKPTCINLHSPSTSQPTLSLHPSYAVDKLPLMFAQMQCLLLDGFSLVVRKALLGNAYHLAAMALSGRCSLKDM